MSQLNKVRAMRILLALIAVAVVLLAFIRPATRKIGVAEATRMIGVAEATRIATNQLFVDVAKDHPEPPNIRHAVMMLSESGDAATHWWAVFNFGVGKKTTGWGYYTISTDGAVIRNASHIGYDDPAAGVITEDAQDSTLSEAETTGVGQSDD